MLPYTTLCVMALDGVTAALHWYTCHMCWVPAKTVCIDTLTMGLTEL